MLVATYSLCLAAYGWVSVILGVYLGALGFPPQLIGLVFTAAVAGGGLMTAILAGALACIPCRAILPEEQRAGATVGAATSFTVGNAAAILRG